MKKINLLREYISKEIKNLLEEGESPFGPEELENLKRLIYSGDRDNLDIVSSILKFYPAVLKNLISDVLNECKKLILSLDQEKINLAFVVLEGLDDAYINNFSSDSFFKKYFKGIYNLVKKEGWGMDFLKAYMSEGKYVDGSNGRYIMMNLFGYTYPYYILYDVVQDKGYCIKETWSEIPTDVALVLIALFNPNAGILPVYKNIYGYNLYKFGNKIFVRDKNSIYSIEGSNVYKINKDLNDEFDYFSEIEINEALPSVIKYILAKNSKEIIGNYNGYDVALKLKTKKGIALSFLKPEYSIFYDEDYSMGESDYIIYLIKNKINVIRYNQFKKKYPELVEYIEKIKNQ